MNHVRGNGQQIQLQLVMVYVLLKSSPVNVCVCNGDKSGVSG